MEAKEKELKEGEDFTIEELEPRIPSPLRGLSSLLIASYLSGMSEIDKLNGFLDSGDYNYIKSQGKKSTLYGKGHNAKGYLKEKDGFKKIEDIGRNDPCKCGSGLKFKKCCMNK